ncbi:hypothetical protein J4G37_27555 [Microvirga sp. 3-52]|nr:hypothetical protein [Microvirga sp. 3-52]
MDEPISIASTNDSDTSRLGTRFLIYPQVPIIAGYERPETVWISTPRGQVAAGPSDHRMYVVDPLLGKAPYQFPSLPPLPGDSYPPVEPGPDGHFDHISIGSREFIAVHCFACVRRVLDICESYLGHEIPWFFSSTYERLEIIPRLSWNNAQSGFGFLELGEDDTREEALPFALNFDVIAHETGHLILLGVIGMPDNPESQPDFLAFHEAASDFIALLGLLHFDSALDKILRRTKGNLLISNELDRLAELMDEKQIRTASHSLRLTEVGMEVHDRSRPFTGGLFDSLVEIYHLLLLERGLVDLDTRSIDYLRRDLSQSDVEQFLLSGQSGYALHHFAYKAALTEARDLIGEAFTKSWLRLDCSQLSLRAAAEAFLAAFEAGRGWRFTDRVYENFRWREILD